MIQTNGLGGFSPAVKPQSYGVGQASPSRLQTVAGQFDQVNISRKITREDQFKQELLSRIAGDVRTANTTGTVQQVKEQVQNGTYQIDPSEIAARLLWRGDSIGHA